MVSKLVIRPTHIITDIYNLTTKVWPNTGENRKDSIEDTMLKLIEERASRFVQW